MIYPVRLVIIQPVPFFYIAKYFCFKALIVVSMERLSHIRLVLSYLHWKM